MDAIPICRGGPGRSERARFRALCGVTPAPLCSGGATHHRHCAPACVDGSAQKGYALLCTALSFPVCSPLGDGGRRAGGCAERECHVAGLSECARFISVLAFCGGDPPLVDGGFWGAPPPPLSRGWRGRGGGGGGARDAAVWPRFGTAAPVGIVTLWAGARHLRFPQTHISRFGDWGGGGTTPAGAPATAADRTQRPDATCEGKNGGLSRAP